MILASLLLLTVLILRVFAAESLLCRQLIRRVVHRAHLSPSLQCTIGRTTSCPFGALVVSTADGKTTVRLAQKVAAPPR